jgi:hypothetical protein
VQVKHVWNARHCTAEIGLYDGFAVELIQATGRAYPNTAHAIFGEGTHGAEGAGGVLEHNGVAVAVGAEAVFQDVAGDAEAV